MTAAKPNCRPAPARSWAAVSSWRQDAGTAERDSSPHPRRTAFRSARAPHSTAGRPRFAVWPRCRAMWNCRSGGWPTVTNARCVSKGRTARSRDRMPACDWSAAAPGPSMRSPISRHATSPISSSARAASSPCSTSATRLRRGWGASSNCGPRWAMRMCCGWAWTIAMRRANCSKPLSAPFRVKSLRAGRRAGPTPISVSSSRMTGPWGQWC